MLYYSTPPNDLESSNYFILWILLCLGQQMRKCQENVPSKDLVQGRGQNRKGKLRQTYRLIVISIVVQANGATSTRGLQRRPAPISPTITAASCTTDPTSSGEAAERTTSIKDVCGDSMDHGLENRERGQNRQKWQCRRWIQCFKPLTLKIGTWP